jgi:hypothetical protein
MFSEGEYPAEFGRRHVRVVSVVTPVSHHEPFRLLACPHSAPNAPPPKPHRYTLISRWLPRRELRNPHGDVTTGKPCSARALP